MASALPKLMPALAALPAFTEIILRVPQPCAEAEELAQKLREAALPRPFTVYTQRSLNTAGQSRSHRPSSAARGRWPSPRNAR